MEQTDYSDYKILLADDEDDILEFLSYNLKKEGFQVFTASDGLQAVKEAIKIQPHLIVLDVMMPNMDGIEACAELNKIDSLKNSLKIFLTARSEDYSQIAGFDAGADDYVTKPIKPKVFVSRIKALLRRLDNQNIGSKEENVNIRIFKYFTIDLERYIIVKGEDEIVLPRKEFKLLKLLTSKPGKVFTREEILNKVWGVDVVVGDRTIDVHIRKIREKLNLKQIKTIKGIGYKFSEKEDE
jgi:two-component system alkaline phosphatase synthesis response regulator PhoP